MKKVLIIGNKGMLGQELEKLFGQDKKYETIGWDLEEIDITDGIPTMKKIIALAPSIIINAAAYNAVDKAEEIWGMEMARKINGMAPKFLAQAAKNIGAIFVHFGTDYVFDGEKKSGYKEDDEPSPVSNYGVSKLMGERQVEWTGGRYYIIRLQKLFGHPAQSTSAKKSFFEVMLALALTKKELEVVDDELANFTYAPDLATQTKYLVEAGYSPGVYHVTNEGKPVTWFGAVQILFEIAGIKDIKLIPVPATRFPRPAKRPKYSVLLNTKLPPLRSWEEALREFLNK